MKKIIVFVTIILGLSGCGYSNFARENNLDGNQKSSLRSIDNVNPNIKMEVIDEIPSMGITVIRFIDAGHTRYIAVRKNDVSMMSTTSSGDKNPTFEDSSISTN